MPPTTLNSEEPDKLSILVTVAVSAVAFHERFTPRYLLGLALICAGTVVMVVA